MRDEAKVREVSLCSHLVVVVEILLKRRRPAEMKELKY